MTTSLEEFSEVFTKGKQTTNKKHFVSPSAAFTKHLARLFPAYLKTLKILKQRMVPYNVRLFGRK